MAKTHYPSDKADQYMVRFPDGMRDRLKEAAASNNRSMNAEIVDLLERSLDFPALPKGLRDRIERDARDNQRTMAEEILQALETSFPPPPTLDDIIERLDDFFARLEGPDEREAGYRDKEKADRVRDLNRVEGLRTYKEFLKTEQAAGRGATATEKFRELYEELPNGVTQLRQPSAKK